MIHDALVAIRKYHGISQTELSIQLGISNSYLSEIEKGKKNQALIFWKNTLKNLICLFHHFYFSPKN
ncbi:MAG TPA: helix-turn-helix transcriptional regulator [Acinetobacter sp.]|nr:helix-turn-helix transcriptional regulator [Acinetobacter sp.]